MKKKDFILLSLFLAAGLIMLLFMLLINQKDPKTDTSSYQLQITVDNEVYGEYPLDEDQTIKINDTNTCRIESGIVSMTEAACPDLICVNTAPIKAPGKAIVCLPNKVVLEIVDKNDAGSDSQETDVVVK